MVVDGLDFDDRTSAGNPSDSSPPSDVLYCHYPFVAVTNICNIQPRDLNFLELQGCLRVPVHGLLCEFLQQYFLHVHPILPLVNERDFWGLYPARLTSAQDGPTKPIPLLVLQAMLFASCTFVSQPTVRKLGFPSTRVMRASYYYRAKLLYDFGSEPAPLCIAQASLLLTFTSLSASRKPNMSWLGIAIENARIADAHLYASIPESSSVSENRNMLKRVWWCCILRDRSTGLLMRRPIQITNHHFHFSSQPLCMTDLEDEFGRSRVYDPETKKRLAEILAHWVQLNIVLTDILMLVFPLYEEQGLSPDQLASITRRISECKHALEQWHRTMAQGLSFSVPRTGTLPSALPETDTEKQHPSVILYYYLMLMYYSTSRVVLSHYEVSQRDILQRSLPAQSPICQGLSTIVGSRQELKDATAGLSLCHDELVSRGLHRWLPVSAIGCTALPLILHTLDTKLAPRNASIVHDHGAHSGQMRNKLHALTQVMQTYQAQYDGVDWINEIIDHIIGLSHIDDLAPGVEEPAINWTDILVFQPDIYLRLTLALDLSLRKGRLAEDEDFPVRLRGLFATKFNSLDNVVKANQTTVVEEPHGDLQLPGVLDLYSTVLDDGWYPPQEQLSPSNSHENMLEDIEAEVYLQLAGGVVDRDPRSSPPTTVFNV